MFEGGTLARTGRVVAAAVVAALLLPAPTRAGTECTIAADPRGDVVVEAETIRPTQAAAGYAGLSPANFGTTATAQASGSGSPGVERGSAPVEDELLDLVSLGARVESTDLAIVIAVKNLLATQDGRTFEYSAIWHVGDTFWVVSARRGPEGWSFSRGSAPRDVALALAAAGRSPAVPIPAGGWVELAAGLITMRMPIAELGYGVTWLEGLYASARDTGQTQVQASPTEPGSVTRRADWTDDGRFPLSGPCPKPPMCPVVTDAAGDAAVGKPIAGVPDTASPALDVLAVGGVGDRGNITVGARVANAAAAPPVGFDLVGWTISWLAKGGGRWVAQAQRSASGTVYSVAFDSAGTQNAVSGPIFGGTSTTGSIDAYRDLVSIVVPRSAVEATRNGTPLRGFGASTWGVGGSSHTGGAYNIFDATETGVYFAGISCAAA